MKKVLIAICLLLGFTVTSMAQVAAKKSTDKAAAAKPAVKPAQPAVAPATPLKADGTPDKRFKANKTMKVPLKKDGTPDKRYKVNKKG